MTDEIGNLLLEHMKRFQATLNRIDRELETLVSRVGRLELAVGDLQNDMAAIHVRLDRVDQRLDRIEKRLDLVD